MSHTRQNTIAEPDKNQMDEVRVAEYLQRHTDFFARHRELLTELVIPHGENLGEGSVVSLVDRQISLLREKNSALEKQQQDLQEIALQNDRIQERLHRIVLQTLVASDINQGIRELTDSLAREFELEHVQLRFFVDESQPLDDIDRAFCIVSQSAQTAMRGFVPTSRPVCGQLNVSQKKRIFGRYGAAIRSGVFIPLCSSMLRGVIAMGTASKSRFVESMDTLYLQRLGELVAASFVRFVK